MLVFIKYYCVDIHEKLTKQVELLEKDVMDGLAASFQFHLGRNSNDSALVYEPKESHWDGR